MRITVDERRLVGCVILNNIIEYIQNIMAELSGDVFKNANVGDIVTHKNHKYMIVYKDTTLGRDFVIKYIPGKSEGEPIKRAGRRSLIDKKYGEKDIVVSGYRVNRKIAKKEDDGRFYKTFVISDLGTVYTIDFDYELKASHGDLWTIYTAEYNKLSGNSAVYNDERAFKITEKALKAIEDVVMFVPNKPTSKKAEGKHIIHWVDEMLRKVRYNDREKKVEELLAMLKNPKTVEDIKFQLESRDYISKHTKRDHGFTYVDWPTAKTK